MKKRTKRNVTSKNRRSERGAALIMMLLISMLLLAAGGALIMTTALSTTTLYESTPETQAYYAAEAGLEDAMAVLRGNVAPQGGGAAAPLGGFMASVAPGGGSTTTTTITDAQKISLRRAVEHATSDAANDPAAAPQLRLSRWLTYNYTPPSGTYPDRVALVDNYSPLTGTAYNLTVRDPDNAKSVAYTTGGTFNNVPGVTLSNAGKTISVENRNLLGILLGTTTITYEPRADNTTFPAYPPATKDLGQFRITSTGIGATIPPGVSFSLNVSQSAPWQANATIRATFSSFLNLGLLTPKVTFLKDTLKLDGTAITLVNKILDLLLPPVGGTAVVPVQANVNAPEPKRIIVRSTGIGPKGARKVLEMVVKRANLDFEAPATLTMRGADDCAPMTFSTGSSNAKEYKGDDVDHPGDPNYSRPAFAVSGCDYDDAVNGTSKPGTVSGSAQIGILGNGTAPAGSMSQAPVETPYFLEDANKARAYLKELEIAARGENRYFKPASGSSMTVNAGTASTPVMTFVDGDCELSGGAGILVVTGNLNMSGNPSFDGVILVLGGGSVNRNGGGSGTVNGSMVVAKFDRTWPPADDDPAIDNAVEYPFLAPFFNTNGGGNSTMQYSSTAVANALNLTGTPRVFGVAEL